MISIGVYAQIYVWNNNICKQRRLSGTSLLRFLWTFRKYSRKTLNFVIFDFKSENVKKRYSKGNRDQISGTLLCNITFYADRNFEETIFYLQKREGPFIPRWVGHRIEIMDLFCRSPLYQFWWLATNIFFKVILLCGQNMLTLYKHSFN